MMAVRGGASMVGLGPPATAFVVWKGHRDYEEPVAAAESRSAADRFVADRGVTLRANFYGRPELMAPDGEPWGIDEVPWLPRVAGIDAPFASAWPGAPVDDHRWLERPRGSAVLFAAAASVGFAGGVLLGRRGG